MDASPVRRSALLSDLLVEVDRRAGRNCELPVLSLTRSHGLVPQTKRFHKRIATADVSRYKRVRRGEIVYNPFVIWEGAVWALRILDEGLVSPAYVVWEVNGADPLFVDFLLRTKHAMDCYDAYSTGAVNRRRTISKRDFLSIDFQIPELAEQRKSSECLNRAWDLATQSRDVISAAAALKGAVHREVFATMSAEEDWPPVPLAEVIVGFQNGLYKPASAYTSSGVPIVRINDYPNQGGVVLTAPRRVELSEVEVARFRLTEGNLLINRVNSISHLGKTALVGKLAEPTVFESNLMRVTVGPRVHPAFLYHYLCSPMAREQLVAGAKRAVAQSSINQGDVGRLQVPVPPLSVQRQVIDAFQSLDSKLAAEEAGLSAAQAVLRAASGALLGDAVVVGIE